MPESELGLNCLMENNLLYAEKNHIFVAFVVGDFDKTIKDKSLLILFD